MNVGHWAGMLGVSAACFVAIDLVWLGFAAKPLYDHFLGPILREKPDALAAVIFYALFVVGLVYFAISPGVDAGSWTHALKLGALYGLFTYATFDLTCRAVLQGFPWGVVPIDLAWGTILAGSTAAAATAIFRALA